MKAHVNQIQSVIAKIICIVVETGCLTGTLMFCYLFYLTVLKYIEIISYRSDP